MQDTWIIYTGEREGAFNVNSRAVTGKKYRVGQGVPTLVHRDDMWIASLRDYQVLHVIDFTPETMRIPLANPSYLPKYCSAWLEGLAATLPDPARVVEIGTGWGTSLLRILYGLSLHEDAHVKSVDLLECPKAKEHLAEAQIPYWRYTMVTNDSIGAAREHTESLDMLYIDGNHSYNGVKADIEAWSGFLKVGGILVFDDYDNGLHEVTPAVNELIMGDGDTWDYIGCVDHLIVFERRHDLGETKELHQEE